MSPGPQLCRPRVGQCWPVRSPFLSGVPEGLAHALLVASLGSGGGTVGPGEGQGCQGRGLLGKRQ